VLSVFKAQQQLLLPAAGPAMTVHYHNHSASSAKASYRWSMSHLAWC
jgi:hypothetical protein